MYQLRQYQREAVDVAVSFFESGPKRNGIIVLPTGAGKSPVIAAYKLDAPVLVFQPSKEILERNYAKLCSYGVWDTGIFSASFNRREVRKITFATIGSVKNYKDYFRRFGRVDDLTLRESKPGLWGVFSGSRQLTNVYFKK